MINIGDIKDLRGNTPYSCVKLSSLLSGIGSRDLVFALDPPTSRAMELSHQRLLRSALHAQRRHEGLQAAFPGMPIRNPNWAIMLACFTALLKGQAQCVKQIRSILDESHTAVLRHIDTLEAHGLIGRQRDRADGRRTQVLLTQRGAAATADYLGSFGDPADDGDPAETASREPAFSAT